MKLWIDGVYVGAAYIAAGLVAAYQCPEYLKEMFKKNVDAELPGVRFDIESGDHPLRVHTVMAKEITGFTNTIKNEINRHSFGFVFSSENAVLGTENIHNIMVYKARNLMSDGKVYEPITRRRSRPISSGSCVTLQATSNRRTSYSSSQTTRRARRADGRRNGDVSMR